MKTIKYVAISITATIYFGLTSINILWWVGVGSVLGSLQMICNGFYLSDKRISTMLFVGAAIFMFFGAWLMLKNKRK